MSVETSLLFGSEGNWSDALITFGASQQTISASSGGLYFDHSTAALSLKSQMETAMGAAGLTDPAFELLQNGYLQLSWSGGNADLTFDDTHLRDVLGFTGNKSGASSYTSDNKPLWVWSGATPIDPLDTPIGTTGRTIYDVAQLVAPGGRTKTILQATHTKGGRLRATWVAKARYKTTDAGLNGEFQSFWENVLVAGHHFLLVGDGENGLVSEDDASSSAMSYTIANQIGPYVLDIGSAGGRNGISAPFERSDQFLDWYYDIEIPVYGVDSSAEYSA